MKGRRSHTYEVWASMVKRCNPSNKGSTYHGKIGITVCKRWLKFSGFLKDMGEVKRGFSIERKNNRRGYSKSNCAWIPRGRQSWNRSCTIWFKIGGDKLPLNVAAKKLGVSFPFLKKWSKKLGDKGAVKEALRFKRTGKFRYP